MKDQPHIVEIDIQNLNTEERKIVISLLKHFAFELPIEKINQSIQQDLVQELNEQLEKHFVTHGPSSRNADHTPDNNDNSQNQTLILNINHETINITPAILDHDEQYTTTPITQKKKTIDSTETTQQSKDKDKKIIQADTKIKDQYKKIIQTISPQIIEAMQKHMIGTLDQQQERLPKTPKTKDKGEGLGK